MNDNQGCCWNKKREGKGKRMKLSSSNDLKAPNTRVYIITFDDVSYFFFFFVQRVIETTSYYNSTIKNSLTFGI